MIGQISFQVILYTGALLAASDLIYSIYLTWVFPPLKSKSKTPVDLKKKSKNALEETPKSTKVEKPIKVAANKNKVLPKKMVNNWFRHLPRTDFRLQPEETLWNTVLFFPEIYPEQGYSQTRQLMWYMEQATSTLKLALYTSSFRLLEDVLFELVKKKVLVTAVTNVPKTLRWRKRGVQVREKPKRMRSPHGGGLLLDHMHHKFIIIDDKAVLTGSLNWTRSAVTENRENMMVTNDTDTVKLYVNEFEKLWEMSDPSVKREEINPSPTGNWYAGQLI